MMEGAIGMKAYVLITGVVFGLLVLMHVWRAVVEGPHIATEPPFIVLTLLSGALCLWAMRLLRRWPRS
jgi:tetrahydromethanopterin S-methyltransferase subunit E